MKTDKNFLLGLFLIGFSSISCTKSFKPEIIELTDNWKIQAQDKTVGNGEEISVKAYSAKDWYETKMPSTVMASLVNQGLYKDLFNDNKLEKVDTKPFDQAWWYRTEFRVDFKQFYQLVFEGINYRANIWLNGTLIADSSKIEGAFGIWHIDVSDFIKKGENVLAVQVFPPKHDDLTIGFVDWNPPAPDKNLGIWRPVKLKSTGVVSMDEPYVITDLNTETLNEANLTIAVKLENKLNRHISATIDCELGGLNFKKNIELQANENLNVELNSNEYKELLIKNPKLWWPNNMGNPNLYKLIVNVWVNNTIQDARDVTFGIRKVEDYWVDKDIKGYKINGKKVLIKGAGWVDDILLADSDDKVTAQLEYVKHMNLNCVRLEGFWGKNKTLYNKADELGILIMIGWSCHWEWEGYCGRPEDDYMCIRTPEDMELQARAYQDQVRWLRNHPSIFTWVYGSDKLPRPELELLLNKYLDEVDGTRPYLISCKGGAIDSVKDKNGDFNKVYYNASKISGPSGVKMLGPYAYTAPNYWYIDKKAGGAFGFNTETGPGPQVPPYESIKKMISDDNIWPLNDMWDFHSGRNEFATLNRYIKAFNARYGEAVNAEDFAFRSQLSNYEAIRAMFEAFEVNKQVNATGVIQWMLNSAWPELFWQLYDWYLMPNGSFYGTKKACQPLNAIYNYGDKNVYLSNDLLQSFQNIKLEATVYDINSKIIYSKNVEVSINENTSKKVIDLPEFKSISETYFLSLKVANNSETLASNFYWLSTQADVHDWDKSEWFYTPYKSYANFTALQNLEKAPVKYTQTSNKHKNGDVTVTYNLENPSDCIAFFIELSIHDKGTGQTLLPVFWDDNYVSLLPGEKRTITAKIEAKYVQDKELSYSIKGINIP